MERNAALGVGRSGARSEETATSSWFEEEAAPTHSSSGSIDSAASFSGKDHGANADPTLREIKTTKAWVVGGLSLKPIERTVTEKPIGPEST